MTGRFVQTNCYVVAAGQGKACVAVDPGQDAADPMKGLSREGSVIFSTPTDERVEVVLAGDTLFAGSIGRTDLPGGDHATMLASLRDTLLTRPDSTVVLPGPGPTTPTGRERESNPFLQNLQPAPGRGL